MIFPNDLGYSSVKTTQDSKRIKFPSVIAKVSNLNEIEPVSFDSKAKEEVYMSEFINHQFVSISSPATSLQGAYLVGEAAYVSSLPMLKLDVNDFSGKAESDISTYISLSTVAAKAVKAYYDHNKELPDNLKVNVKMATALPVSEGKTKGVADQYKRRYLGHKHVVTINNFADPIVVTITFTDMYVGLEGELAQFSITNADNDLKKFISKELQTNYPKIAKDMSVEDLIGLEDVLSLDLGGGTADAVAIINGVANASASDSIRYGMGNVIQEAITVLQSKKINFDDRAALQEYLLTKPNPITKEKYNYVKQVVMESAEPFINKVVEMASKTLRKAGSKVSVVYVYGGGASALIDSTLKEKLQNKLAEFNGGFEIPVIWIDPKYSQFLNERGLELICDYMFKEDEAND